MVELITERLRIRDHVPGDLEAMHRLLADPVAMRYLPELQTGSLAQSRENLAQAMAETGEAVDAETRKRWFFAVTDRETDRYLGEIGYTVLTDSPMGKVAQLGYFLLPEFWRQGIAVEAAEAVLRFAFDSGHVFKMETGCLRENAASEKVMQKLGMTKEAELRHHTLHEGVLKDRVTYRMLRSEWTARREMRTSQAQLVHRTSAMTDALPSCLPKAVLFDYGQTLIDEIGFDAVAGTEAVLREAVENPEGVPAWEVQALADALLREIGRRGVDPQSQHPVEFHNHLFYRYLYESFGMRFKLPLAEVERIFWDTAAPGRPTPGMPELLAHLREKGIRTGVISNISFSGEVLRERIDRLFPEHRFAFVMASSEYVFRKPHQRIFQLALRKLDLPAQAVWYCGDHAWFDVHGATEAGLFPIWYTGCHHAPETNIPGASGSQPTDPCFQVSAWSELIRLMAHL